MPSIALARAQIGARAEEIAVVTFNYDYDNGSITAIC
jgi:hypothetical protein